MCMFHLCNFCLKFDFLRVLKINLLSILSRVENYNNIIVLLEINSDSMNLHVHGWKTNSSTTILQSTNNVKFWANLVLVFLNFAEF